MYWRRYTGRDCVGMCDGAGSRSIAVSAGRGVRLLASICSQFCPCECGGWVVGIATCGADVGVFAGWGGATDHLGWSIQRGSVADTGVRDRFDWFGCFAAILVLCGFANLRIGGVGSAGGAHAAGFVFRAGD